MNARRTQPKTDAAKARDARRHHPDRSDHAGARLRDARTTTPCSCSARTSASTAACSAPPPACSSSFGSERVLDTPLDETTIAGLTVGLASQGMKPVAEAQFDGFVYPMVDHIICHAARFRYRTRGRLTCPMVLRVPWGGGIRAPEHHSEANEAIFTNVPGLRVVMPSSPARAYGLLLAAIRDPDPVIFMEPKRIYRQYKEVVPDDGEALPLDVCYVLRDGTDVTLVTWGAQVKETLEAAEKLASDGISAEVIDVATLRPLDFATIAESVSKTGRCVIVHEAPKTAGFGAEIAARLAEESMYDLRRAGRARHRLRHAHPAVPPGDEVPAERGHASSPRPSATLAAG